MPSKTPILEEIAKNMVFVKGGKLKLGEQGELPVDLPDFSIGKYPVTNAEFVHFLNAEGNQTEGGSTWVNLEGSYEGVVCGIVSTGQGFEVKKGLEQNPMVYVNWYGARAYCQWLAAQTGDLYRLPSEAQWEYAARGGQQSKGFLYAGSHNLKEVGWYDNNSHSETKPVGLKKANELGLYDMSGNVWEWCADEWQEDITKVPKDGSPAKGKGDNSAFVVRGGSWYNYDYSCTVSNRSRNDANFRVNRGIGFRVSRY